MIQISLAENEVKYKSMSSIENLSTESFVFAFKNFDFMIEASLPFLNQVVISALVSAG